MEKVQKTLKANILSGFKKCGIFSFNPDAVISQLPQCNESAKALRDRMASANGTSELSDDYNNAQFSPQSQSNITDSSSTERDQNGTFHSNPSTSGVCTIKSSLDTSLVNIFIKVWTLYFYTFPWQ